MPTSFRQDGVPLDDDVLPAVHEDARGHAGGAAEAVLGHAVAAADAVAGDVDRRVGAAALAADEVDADVVVVVDVVVA